MPFSEDLTPFFNVAEFATAATLDGAAVQGIFDREYIVAQPGEEVAISGPAFSLPSASVPATPIGLALVIDGEAFTVIEPMPDGTGVTVLRLRQE